MAYELIEKVELNNSENKYIKVIRYAILEKNGRYYVQIKLRNKSQYLIKKFDLVYEDEQGEKVYTTHQVNAAPGEVFFDRELIEIPSDKFEFICFENVLGKVYYEEETPRKAVNKRKTKKGRNYIYTSKQKKIIYIMLVASLISLLLAILLFFSEDFDVGGIIRIILFVIPIILLICLVNYASKAKKTNMSEEEKKNLGKDLTPTLMWMCAMFTCSIVFPIISIIEFGYLPGLSIIVTFFCLLLGLIFLSFYKVKINKYKDICVKRKWTSLILIGASLMLIVQLFFFLSPYISH